MDFLNKRQMARVLRCSLPTLDALLQRYGAAFPVQRHGAKGTEYRFDPAAVTAFLREREEELRAATARRDTVITQFTLPGVEAIDSGIRPSDRLALIRSQIIKNQLAKEARFLVLASEVREAETTAINMLVQHMGSAIRRVLEDHNVPAAVILAIEARIDAAVQQFRDSVESFFSQPDEGGEPRLL